MSASSSSCYIPPMIRHVALKDNPFVTGHNSSHMRIEGQDCSHVVISHGSHHVDVTGGIASHVSVGAEAYNVKITLRENGRVICNRDCHDIFINIVLRPHQDIQRDHPVRLEKGCKNITFNGQTIA